MPSVYVITLIIVLLAALVCYVFLMQTLSYRKEKRDRMFNALQLRAKDFRFILESFPAGYLAKDLSLLVQKSLIQVLQQLVKISPDAAYRQQISALEILMADTERQPAQKTNTQTLPDPKNIKDLNACLEELAKYIVNLQAQGILSKAQVSDYQNQIAVQIIQISVDTNLLQARAAKDKNKLKLAYHHFGLAIKLMLKARKSGQFEAKIHAAQAQMSELEERIKTDDPSSASVADPTLADSTSEATSEWNNFGAKEDWQKKNIYD